MTEKIYFYKVSPSESVLRQLDTKGYKHSLESETFSAMTLFSKILFLSPHAYSSPGHDSSL